MLRARSRVAATSDGVHEVGASDRDAELILAVGVHDARAEGRVVVAYEITLGNQHLGVEQQQRLLVLDEGASRDEDARAWQRDGGSRSRTLVSGAVLVERVWWWESDVQQASDAHFIVVLVGALVRVQE